MLSAMISQLRHANVWIFLKRSSSTTQPYTNNTYAVFRRLSAIEGERCKSHDPFPQMELIQISEANLRKRLRYLAHN
jgi:hypothetical protein